MVEQSGDRRRKRAAITNAPAPEPRVYGTACCPRPRIRRQRCRPCPARRRCLRPASGGGSHRRAKWSWIKIVVMVYSSSSSEQRAAAAKQPVARRIWWTPGGQRLTLQERVCHVVHVARWVVPEEVCAQSESAGSEQAALVSEGACDATR